MTKERWIAIFTLVAGAMLLALGQLFMSALFNAQDAQPCGIGPYCSAEDVAYVKSFLPWLYLVSLEGLVLGSVAVVGAIALLAKRRWGLAVLRVGSVALIGCSIAATVMAPQSWDYQGIFLLFGAAFLWSVRKHHEAAVSAL